MRFSRQRGLTFALFLGLTLYVGLAMVQAATFHVSPQGSNTPPYATYGTAAQRIIDAVRLATGANDTVLVHSGSYDVDSTLYIARGVTWLGVGRASVIVSWIDESYGSTQLSRLLGQNEVAGMDFRYPFGKNNTVAIALWAQTYPEADTVNIHDCRFELFYPAIGGNTFAFLHDNVFYHGAADGIYVAGLYVRIYNNLFSGWRIGNGVHIYDAGTVLIDHNIFDNTQLKPEDSLRSWPDATVYVNGAVQVTLRNNVIRHTRRQFTWLYANGIIENNTFIDTGDPYAVSSVDDSYTYQRYYQTLSIRNNLFYQSARMRFGLSCDDCDSTGWITLSYNTFWPPMTSFYVKNPVDPPERIKVFDSMNVNAYPILTPDSLYHLQAYSPLIDGGDPTLLDTDESRSDIGWTGGLDGYSYPHLDLSPEPPESLWVSGGEGLVQIAWSARHESDLE